MSTKSKSLYEKVSEKDRDLDLRSSRKKTLQEKKGAWRVGADRDGESAPPLGKESVFG